MELSFIKLHQLVRRRHTSMSTRTENTGFGLSRVGRSHPTLLPTPYSLLSTPYTLLPTLYSLLFIPCTQLPTPYSLLVCPGRAVITKGRDGRGPCSKTTELAVIERLGRFDG